MDLPAEPETNSGRPLPGNPPCAAPDPRASAELSRRIRLWRERCAAARARAAREAEQARRSIRALAPVVTPAPDVPPAWAHARRLRAELERWLELPTAEWPSDRVDGDDTRRPA